MKSLIFVKCSRVFGRDDALKAPFSRFTPLTTVQGCAGHGLNTFIVSSKEFTNGDDIHLIDSNPLMSCRVAVACY